MINVIYWDGGNDKMSDTKIGRITLGICATNTYFLYKEDSRDIVVIDPADKGDFLYGKFNEKGFNVKAIILTHGHFDHIWGIELLKELSEAPVYASEDEKELLKNVNENASKMAGRPCTVKPDFLLKDNEEFELCGIKIKMIKTPGHTIGGCCYYIEDAGFLISGDTLFRESVGRTDLPTGSMGTLVKSIKEKIMVLPDDTKVYPGHGPETTIGFEKENNPFL